jgi:hypothetical protein
VHVIDTEIHTYSIRYTHTHHSQWYTLREHCMSDGSLGSLHRWRSQRIAKLSVVWIARHIGYFTVAAEHLTHWTYISLSRTFLSTIWFVIIRRLQRARLRVLSYIRIFTHIRISHIYILAHLAREIFHVLFSPTTVFTLSVTAKLVHTAHAEYLLTADILIYIHTVIYMQTCYITHMQTVIPFD